MKKFGNDWDDLLKKEFEKEYYLALRNFLKEEYTNKKIYPEPEDIFNCFKLTPYHKVKVVILGQDPYHEPGQAHGLSFSVPEGVRKPPSLRNIFQEMEADINIKQPDHGCLVGWAKEGVLLLNTVLTVEAHKANSHQGKGWEEFTDQVISLLNIRETPMVFWLWGSNARSKKKLITGKQHLILESVHPSPLSAYRGYFGSHFFTKTNDFLKEKICWDLSSGRKI